MESGVLLEAVSLLLRGRGKAVYILPSSDPSLALLLVGFTEYDDDLFLNGKFYIIEYHWSIIVPLVEPSDHINLYTNSGGNLIWKKTLLWKSNQGPHEPYASTWALPLSKA
ncbi:hypothetical protein Hanom_Chr12g01175111 [Helianthus anomalus]